MPRPGSRPYECVRRAWHSDRHQPMRGSLIQEIFRVVSEIHGSATKKNKEWQDKLPVVVLKAEEIIYSKANSEAEYMDLETLWDRANDAINTIIRLDESTETGVSLQPCIEAALILGCTPRRATRSQRNSTPSYYLNVAGAEPTCHPSRNLHKGTLGTQNTNGPFILDYSKIFTASNMTENNPTRDEWPVFCPSTMTPSIYPLYYGLESQSNDSKIGVENPFKSDCCKEGPTEMGVIQDMSSCCTDARDKIKKADLRSTCENSPTTGCDLSLRLGPCMHPLSSIKNRRPQEVKGFGSHNSHGTKFRDLDPQLNKFFSSLQSDAAGINSSYASTSNCGSKREKLNLDATVKKRKGVANHLYEDRQNSCQAKLPFDHHVGRMRSADPSKANSKAPTFWVNTST